MLYNAVVDFAGDLENLLPDFVELGQARRRNIHATCSEFGLLFKWLDHDQRISNPLFRASEAAVCAAAAGVLYALL